MQEALQVRGAASASVPITLTLDDEIYERKELFYRVIDSEESWYRYTSSLGFAILVKEYGGLASQARDKEAELSRALNPASSINFAENSQGQLCLILAEDHLAGRFYLEALRQAYHAAHAQGIYCGAKKAVGLVQGDGKVRLFELGQSQRFSDPSPFEEEAFPSPELYILRDTQAFLKLTQDYYASEFYGILEWIYAPRNTEELKYFIESLVYFNETFQKQEKSLPWRLLFEYLKQHYMEQGLAFKKALKCSVLISLVLQFDQFEKLPAEVTPSSILAVALVVLSTMAKRELVDSVFFPQKLQDCSQRIGISWESGKDYSEKNLLGEVCRGYQNQTEHILEGFGIFKNQVEGLLPAPEPKSSDDYLFS